MSTTYTPTAAALTTLTLPADADARSAASVNVPIEALADAVVSLQGNIGVVRLVGISMTGTDDTFLTDHGTSTSDTFGAAGDDPLGTYTVLQNDYVNIDVSFLASNSAASQGGYQLAYALDGGAKVGVAESRIHWAGMPTSNTPAQVSACFQAPAAGSMVVYLQQRTASSSTIRITSPMAVRVQIYRVV
jgi:hypothetical protein